MKAVDHDLRTVDEIAELRSQITSVSARRSRSRTRSRATASSERIESITRTVLAVCNVLRGEYRCRCPTFRGSGRAGTAGRCVNVPRPLYSPTGARHSHSRPAKQTPCARPAPIDVHVARPIAARSAITFSTSVCALKSGRQRRDALARRLSRHRPAQCRQRRVHSCRETAPNRTAYLLL